MKRHPILGNWYFPGMLTLIGAAIICASYAFADDLDDVATICEAHVIRTFGSPQELVGGRPAPMQKMIKPQNSPTEPHQWDHCVALLNTHDARQKARADADEDKNPDLKKTRDLARKLKIGN